MAIILLFKFFVMGELNTLLGTYPGLSPFFTVLETISDFSIVFFLLSAWGLFMINKKLGEKYAWLSFIPLIQLYSYATAANKSFKVYIVYPLLAMFIGGLLAIPSFGLSILIAIIYLIVMVIRLYHAISVRCGRGAWTTIGLLFIGFIMFPVVGYKLEDKSTKSPSENNNELIVENKPIQSVNNVSDKVEISEEKIEL